MTRKHHRIERAYGSFERSFTIPPETDGAKISSEFKDGILTVHLPKNAEGKPTAKQIEIR